MPELKHSLTRLDFSQLKIIAENWAVELSAGDARQAAAELEEHLLNPDRFQVGLEGLPDEARQALSWLEEENGRRPWSHFVRKYGEIREMGAGKLERDRPDQSPTSPAEMLWYRALVARGFFETESGPQEFAYLPEEIRSLIEDMLQPREAGRAESDMICRQATEEERAIPIPVDDRLLDHFCTVLAARRMDLDPAIHLQETGEDQRAFLAGLGRAAKLLTAAGQPDPEALRNYFDLSPRAAFLRLWKSWRESGDHNDLLLTPGIDLEATPEISSRQVRGSVLEMISQLDPTSWWSLNSFLAQVKSRHPDFLRTAGEYDSWYIRDSRSGMFLRGFEHWERVEGSLLRYLITGPLHWLGLLDLAEAEQGFGVTAFRMSRWADQLISGKEPEIRDQQEEPIQVRSLGEIRVTLQVSHKVRYQLARFCDWRPIIAESYRYALTPESLQRAESQQLRTVHLMTLLESHAEAVPPNITAALKHWEQKGVQASIKQEPILRVSSPDMLRKLQNSRAKRFLQEELGPTAMIIRAGSEQKIAEVLVELGYLTDY